MCEPSQPNQPDLSALDSLVRQASGETGATVLTIAPHSHGSRCRRLWEFDDARFAR